MRRPPLYLAVAGLHSECVKELLKGRVPLATLDVRPRWWGHTALHLAVLSENLELVKELIRKGASLEVGTRFGGSLEIFLLIQILIVQHCI